ncbi:hypothetical protein B566_EDAN012016 [Ephemera danica]|nr:hypothetical protein B566_EDAN012016 [Ephemera danica]
MRMHLCMVPLKAADCGRSSLVLSVALIVMASILIASINIAQLNSTFDNKTVLLNFSRVEQEVGLRYSVATTIVLCIAYSAVCVLGVVGNCVVVAVVRRTPRMRNATNVFIANLACADLLVNVICLPFTLLSNILSAWILGAVICKTVPYLQGVSVSASVHTLVAIAVERCLAICCPMRAPVMSSSTCYIWPTPSCGDMYFVAAHLIMCYLAPLAVISVCYTLVWRRVLKRRLPGETTQGRNVAIMMHRTRAKAIQMLIVVVTSFALSWLPLYALFVWVKLGPPPRSPAEEAFIDATLPVAQWLGAANSCINPVLYAFFNRRFRAGLNNKQLRQEQPSSLLVLRRRGCVHRRGTTAACRLSTAVTVRHSRRHAAPSPRNNQKPNVTCNLRDVARVQSTAI